MASPEPLECPRCGAPLPKGSGGTIVCKYCRVTVNLPQRPVPPNRHPVRHAGGLPDWVKGWLKVETLIALCIGVGMAAWQLQRHWVVPAAPPPEVPNQTPHVGQPPNEPSEPAAAQTLQPAEVGGKLLLVAGKGEQQLVVALARFKGEGEQPWLTAWSSDTGTLVWRWSTPRGSRPSNVEWAHHGGSVVARTAEVVARLDVDTGRVVWTGPAPSPRGRLCATAAYIGVATEKPPTNVLDWESGRPFQVKRGPCETPYSSSDAGPNFTYLEPAALSGLPKPPKDFSVLRALLPKQGNARVILGTSRADGAPAVSVVANKRWVWQQNVSVHTAAQLPVPPLAAVRRESVVVPYWDTQNEVLRLAAFNLSNGGRLWEAAVTDRTSVRRDSALDVGVTLNGVVLVSFDGRLSALSLSTGETQWSLGR